MDANNKYRFILPTDNQYINLPLEIKWDFTGRDDSIELYEDEVIGGILGSPKDYEIARFAHETHNSSSRTDINYEFNFFNGTKVDIPTAVITDWQSSYINEGFTESQVYYYNKPFTKSFFKLDFYDTTDVNSQTIYMTIIIPVQQGLTELATISSYLSSVNIKKPTFKLDYVGDKEGFFIYWLRKEETLNLSNFFMSAKFFDGRLGVFVKMMSVPQSSLPDRFNFDSKKYFYYKVKLNRDNYTYSVFDLNNVRIGETNPIKWYEYVNP